MRIRLRKLWLTTHRWIGLTAGLLFVLVGLSGSFLVFQHTIDEWLNPETLLTRGRGVPRPLNEVVAAAEKKKPAFPGPPARAHFVMPPHAENGVWTVWFQRGADKEGFAQVYVDPYTAEVVGRRVQGEYLVSWIHRLHVQLLAGPIGESVVGVTGLMMLVSVATGIALWWPLWKNSWRAAFAVRGGRRFNYDLHKTSGVVSAVVLVVSCFTGVYLVFPDWIRPCVNVVSAETVFPPKALRSKPCPGLPRIDAGAAAAVAQKVFPDGELKRLQFPARADDPYLARVRQAGDVRRSSGNSRVWIDQYSGEVLAVRDWNNRTAADAFFAWQFPLHNGEAFGLTGRWIIFAAGLAPGALYVTGIVLWWRRRLSQQRQGQRQRGATLDGRQSTRGLEPVPSS